MSMQIFTIMSAASVVSLAYGWTFPLKENWTMGCFLIIMEDMDLNLNRYSQLKDELETCLADFKKHSDDLCIFNAPLPVSVVPPILTI